ncbi:UV DNA damage repair endonuclease UvsE [Paenibacillus glycanilyticus]|uniref:UV damage endonuclease UvsE n=1 Tax=Paenibacillus glycanilyticus TaxID=126569 RepID=A0ABQ6GLH1_9BACL|nr:UV DNA damage repair endonuclease UvsE [Paenibacillus glycanilyticus]GLX70196.1 UV damage endonuclease UvsE [Paenibacillus glycanilyticus]
MIVRFGFVAMSMILENASPSRTMTFANFSKLNDREAGLRKIERIAEENLRSTLRVMKHANAHDIHMYRFSSKLIPLSTHNELADWDPFPALKPAMKEIGDFAKKTGMRTSFHPDHFCVFSTNRPDVLVNSERDLEYHIRMLEAMELPETSKCNIHMGGAYGDKKLSAERFVQQFGALSERHKQRVTLENDDKTFDVRETLAAAEAVGVPMVLDIHHHAVNSGDITMDELSAGLWPRIARTWSIEEQRLGLEAGELPPKIHASSPKSLSDPRGHADYLEPEPLLQFLRSVASATPRIDCMLEAKQKDASLLKLMEDIKEIAASGNGIRFLDGSTIEIEP